MFLQHLPHRRIFDIPPEHPVSFSPRRDMHRFTTEFFKLLSVFGGSEQEFFSIEPPVERIIIVLLTSLPLCFLKMMLLLNFLEDLFRTGGTANQVRLFIYRYHIKSCNRR